MYSEVRDRLGPRITCNLHQLSIKKVAHTHMTVVSRGGATLRAKRVLGSKILCVVNVYGLEEGLHASRDSPDYVEDDQDYLDFLTDSLPSMEMERALLRPCN